jgi:hypothetical protein
MRKRLGILLCLLAAAAPLAASGCYSRYVYTDRANATFPGSLTFGETFSSKGGGGRSFDDHLFYDVLELFLQPVFLFLDVITLRFIWDHRVFPLSGLVSMVLRVLGLLPGYTHVDFPAVTGVLGP